MGERVCGLTEAAPDCLTSFELGKKEVLAEGQWWAAGAASDQLSSLASLVSVTFCQFGRKRTEFLPSPCGGLPASTWKQSALVPAVGGERCTTWPF